MGHVPAVDGFFPLGSGSALSAFTSTINTVNTAFLTSTSAFVSAPGGPAPDQQGGGAWARAIAGTVDTDISSVGTRDNSQVTPPITPATGFQTCNTTTRTDYWGYQVGHDISILNGGGTGASFHVGVTAGYLEARTKDTTPAGSFTNPNFPPGVYGGLAFGGTFFTPAGSFSEDSQVPFAGVYAAFTKGNLALDGQVRVDWHQNRISEPVYGLFSQPLDARGLSLTANAAYNIPLQKNWFIEPGIGVVWSRTEIDPLNVPGILVPGVGGGSFPIARGRVDINDIESVLGRASVSVGTTFTQGRVTWQPFFTASVFHEFDGDVTARSTIVNPAVITTVRCSRLGRKAELAPTVSSPSARPRCSAIPAGSATPAATIASATTSRAGVSTPACGTSSPRRRRAASRMAGRWCMPTTGPVRTWERSLGTSWGQEYWRFAAFGTGVQPDFAGYVAGGQVGYNLQTGNAVIGVEADYGFSNAHGGVNCPNPFFFSCKAAVDDLASLTARLGLAWGRALLYAKGGLAVAEVSAGTYFNNPPVTTGVDTNWRYGWTLAAAWSSLLLTGGPPRPNTCTTTWARRLS